jgi:hypothetical protein
MNGVPPTALLFWNALRTILLSLRPRNHATATVVRKTGRNSGNISVIDACSRVNLRTWSRALTTESLLCAHMQFKPAQLK